MDTNNSQERITVEQVKSIVDSASGADRRNFVEWCDSSWRARVEVLPPDFVQMFEALTGATNSFHSMLEVRLAIKLVLARRGQVLELSAIEDLTRVLNDVKAWHKL